MIPALAERSSPVLSGVIGRSPAYLGELSYAIYRLCVPLNLLFVDSVSHLAGHQKDGLLDYAWLFMVIGLIPLAAARHHLVERPGRIRIRGLGQGRRAPAASVA